MKTALAFKLNKVSNISFYHGINEDINFDKRSANVC